MVRLDRRVRSQQAFCWVPLSRPLTNRTERGLDCERSRYGEQDQAQQNPQPGEDEAEVVADGGEHGVGGVAFAAFEIAATEVTFGLQVADHRFDGGPASPTNA
jgi:hypothetical protein